MPKLSKASNRLRCENVDIRLDISDGFHLLTVTLAYDPTSGALREINFVGRGKIGHGIDFMLHELGIKLSRAIQGRDPDTGHSSLRSLPHVLPPKTP